MTQATLFDQPHFDGPTYDAALDKERLGRQLDRVRDMLLGHRGEWFTLAEIAAVVPGSHTGISARLRQLRDPKFGGHKVQSRRRSGGTWEYGVLKEE